MKTLYLIACSKDKAPEESKAKDLYLGQLFRLCRQLAEKPSTQATQWRILSARHGVVHPEESLEPYEKSIQSLTEAELAVWRYDVANDLLGLLPRRVVFLASKPYIDFIAHLYRHRGVSVETPLAGLGIGQQKQWLKRAIEGGA